MWFFDKVSSQKLLHQNQKPVDIITQCIEKHSDDGAIVFDGFMGSGTTAIACIKSNRHYIGCELDSDYYDVAIKRIKEAQNGI